MHSRSFGEEIEDDTIGDLHPDEDDLFSGVTDALGSSAHAKTTDDFEDFDLFSSGGGMELEGDELLVSGKRISGLELDGDSAYFGGSKGKSPFGEQSSRTLFVRKITSNEEDSEVKALFEVNLYSFNLDEVLYTTCSDIKADYFVCFCSNMEEISEPFILPASIKGLFWFHIMT
jgi:hypothetical protein